MINSTERDIETVVREAVEKHSASRDSLIPILTEINYELGYLPAEALTEVKKQMRKGEDQAFVSEGQLYSLASFYDMLSTKPHGRHVVKFCESAPCHVVGGREVWQALLEELHLKNGEISPDGRWSLATTSCLGVCGVGPVMLVDNDIYGNVRPEQVHDILGKYE
jgi:NADH:ubiquinone oxidoreductase subunit E